MVIFLLTTYLTRFRKSWIVKNYEKNFAYVGITNFEKMSKESAYRQFSDVPEPLVGATVHNKKG